MTHLSQSALLELVDRIAKNIQESVILKTEENILRSAYGLSGEALTRLYLMSLITGQNPPSSADFESIENLGFELPRELYQ